VWQFQDLALRETGQHLSRERLIVWRLWTKLQNLGWHVDWESPYPRSRRKCDLVVALRNSARLWLEVKVSWRAWFECERGPVHSNPAYRSYLMGTHRTHSLRHDLEKLGQNPSLAGDYRGVCLIGFDSKRSPMDEDVRSILKSAHERGLPWQATAERHWPDRRNNDFRINVWGWCCRRPPSHRLNRERPRSARPRSLP
jgi:hypothetical protein